MMRRPLLLPLVPLYAAGLALKRRRFAGDARRLGWPVVSVGSLSAGGAGKTPVVLALAELLGRHGYGVDVLSRGYRREAAAVERVDPAGTAERFGDEPLLLARAGLEVFLGASRYRAGVLAESGASQPLQQLTSHPSQEREGWGTREWGGRRVHLLDDGFQHRRLARALDVVLLTEEDVSDWLLPAGNLREPLRRIAAAGAMVVREEEEAALRPVLARLGAGAVPVWVVRRRLAAEVEGRVVAFCGIARPEGFFAMLREVGVRLAGTVVFGDHHRYTERDLARLARMVRELGAEGLVTTEKDAVKVAGRLEGRLEGLSVARLRVEFLGEDAVVGVVGAAVSDWKV